MDLSSILDAIAECCDGKQSSETVQVTADLLLAAQQELKGKAQMAKDLEMARDEASMKPSVARKLNEKIRGLEAELEELRSNKKVKELEKKVQFLEHELKQSYTTKNFTLKSGLLELEKQYRPHMNVDPNMAAFWDDIVVLLDEKKERDTSSQLKGPRPAGPTAADSAGLRTPRLSTSSLSSTLSTTAPAAVGAAETPRPSDSDVAPTTSPAPPTNVPSMPAQELESSGSITAVQMQVESFNTKISEEAASAASNPNDLGSSKQESEGMVVRHGAGFRVVRAAGSVDPQADVVAASGQVTEQQERQPVALLSKTFAGSWQDVKFHAIPASKQSASADVGVQQPHAGEELLHTAEAVEGSIQALMQHFSSLEAAAHSLAQPPDDTGHQQQSSNDTAALWQQQLQQLQHSAKQLSQKSTDSLLSEQQQHQAHMTDVLQSISRMQDALNSSKASAGGETAHQQQTATVASHLSELQQLLLQLQQCQQRAAAEAGGQQMLASIFGEFMSQLDQQGMLSPEAADHGKQQPVLVKLLHNFLQVNPQVPQQLALQLAAAIPPQQQQQQVESGLSQPADAAASQQSSVAVQAVVDASNREVQSEPTAVQHAGIQSEASAGQHASTQYEAANGHHASTQSDTPASGQVETQTDTVGGSADHVSTQTDTVQLSVSHVSTQAVAEAASAEVQTSPPTPVAAAVQVMLQPEVSEAGAQVDFTAAAGEVGVGEPEAQQEAGGAAQNDLSGSQAAAGELSQRTRSAVGSQHGSGIIYSASGSELSIGKAAVGQQLDILHQIERSRAGDSVDGGSGGSQSAIAAVVNVKPEELLDPTAVAKELGQLRADNVELAANLQVTQSLVDHLNSNLKSAIDKADDAEAEAVAVQQQLDKATATLQQLQSEHAELTHVLIEAKVEIAEKKGELLKLVRDLRRAISNPVNAAGVVKELENILAVVPSADDDSDVPQSPARAAQPISRQGSSFDAARQSGLAGLAAGLGHMRDALGGLSAALPAGISRTGRMSDSAVEGSGTMPFAADAASTPASSGTVQEKTRL